MSSAVRNLFKPLEIRGLVLLKIQELVHLGPSIWPGSYSSSSKQQLVRPISFSHPPTECPTTPCAQRYCLTRKFLPWTSLNSQTALNWWLGGIERKGKIYFRLKHASWKSVLARINSSIVSSSMLEGANGRLVQPVSSVATFSEIGNTKHCFCSCYTSPLVSLMELYTGRCWIRSFN